MTRLKLLFFFKLSSIIVLIVLASILLGGKTAFSQSDNPFGGQVYLQIKCTCGSNQSWIFIGSPSSGQYIIQQSTRIYIQRPVSIGEWVLGLASNSQDAQCEVQTGNNCTTLQGYGIKIIGSS